ncbi:MAG TPA: hypothetical protein VM307_12025, partial [Egibacteraceae bacterium]|nr:hypothetical protein [Egibacteraceae bacterium]
MTTPHLDRLVVNARRRMRVNRALWIAARAVVIAGGVLVLWHAAARAVLLPAADTLVWAGAVAIVATTVGAASTLRIPPVWAAWAADRWLATDDRYATAVELAGSTAALAAAQVRTAEESAAGVRRFPQGPRVPVRHFAVGAGLVAVAGVLGTLPNPQDDVRARLAAERAAIQAQADQLRTAAEDLDAADAEQGEVAQQLRRLAQELEQADRAHALQRLAEQRADLARRIDPAAAAKRTALSGLAQELAARPLGDGDTVRRQLDDLAQRLTAGDLDQ